MAKEVVNIPNRPKTPYSPGIKAGNYIFVSGQLGFMDDQGKELKGIEDQTRRGLENVTQVLEAAGSSLSEVVKVTVFLAKADDFTKMNEVYLSYFTKNLPARSTVITGLPLPGMVVEIECIAYHP
jgi:2-iminobutanoate/2-iminopropanoate deaminase